MYCAFYNLQSTLPCQWVVESSIIWLDNSADVTMSKSRNNIKQASAQMHLKNLYNWSSCLEKGTDLNSNYITVCDYLKKAINLFESDTSQNNARYLVWMDLYYNS